MGNLSMNSNDIKKIANAMWGKYKVVGNENGATSPLTYHFGTQMQSLLGKQNVATTGNNRRVFAKNDNSFDYNNSNLNSKSFSITNAHNYFVAFKITSSVSGFIGATSPAQFFASGTLTGLGSGTLASLGTDIYGCLITSSSTENANVSIYNNGSGGESTTHFAIVLDLTELGLDTLTAQQFYNQYNHLFDKLANGEIVNKPFTLTLLKDYTFNDISFRYANGRFFWYYPTLPTTLPDVKTSGTNMFSQVYGQAKSDLTELDQSDYGCMWYNNGFFVKDKDAGEDGDYIKNKLNGTHLYYEPSTPITLAQNDYYINTNGKLYKSGTTETINSAMIRSGVTKVTDANGVEVEFE